MNQEMGGAELATYCLILIVNVLAENIGNDGVSVQDKFGLEGDKSVASKRSALNSR